MPLPADSAAPASAQPLGPATLDEAGLPFALVCDLLLKDMHGSGELSGTELSRRVGLPFPAIEAIVDHLKTQRLFEIHGGSLLGGGSYRYRLTDLGRERAAEALGRNEYVGPAPVPIAQYRRYMTEFCRSEFTPVNPEQVRQAFSELVLSDEVLSELGPAINARHSIFIYGPPGNGKTAMANKVRHLLTGTIAIPHALEVGGHIVCLFDPAIHERVPPDESEPAARDRFDGRWVQCRRPMVSVGGELTLEGLTLAFNSRSGVYRAPVQTLANGGVLLIDDFGRQHCPPRDLLNWWMVPLESRIEYMTLQSGEKVEMPFLPLIIFATNIRPAELVDEAFLRRIQYKIYAQSPTRGDFTRIFERCCMTAGVPFDRALVDNLLEKYYAPRHLALRACHPRDLISQALALASYRGEPRHLTAQLLEAACTSYFVDDEPEASQERR